MIHFYSTSLVALPLLLLLVITKQVGRELSMPAVRDENMNSTFIYTNFYELYLKSKASKVSGSEPAKGMILKTRAITENPVSSEKTIFSTEQKEQLHQWTHSSLNSNYRTLRNSRKKLKFLMSEIEELLKYE